MENGLRKWKRLEADAVRQREGSQHGQCRDDCVSPLLCRLTPMKNVLPAAGGIKGRRAAVAATAARPAGRMAWSSPARLRGVAEARSGGGRNAAGREARRADPRRSAAEAAAELIGGRGSSLQRPQQLGEGAQCRQETKRAVCGMRHGLRGERR